MREAGELDAPVPSADWVAFQFRPRRPTSGVAQRYTGRWAIKLQVPSYTLKCPHHPSPADCSRCSRPPPRRKVLQMTLRKHHPDGHWCNASEKNIKGFIREFDDRFMADMKRLSDLRSDMERLLEVMSRLPSESTAIGDARDHSSSEREAEQLALKVGHLAALAFKYRGIPANDLKGWLSGEASVRIARMSDDTKCKVPVGEPGARVSTNERAFSCPPQRRARCARPRLAPRFDHAVGHTPLLDARAFRSQPVVATRPAQRPALRLDLPRGECLSQCCRDV